MSSVYYSAHTVFYIVVIYQHKSDILILVDILDSYRIVYWGILADILVSYRNVYWRIYWGKTSILGDILTRLLLADILANILVRYRTVYWGIYWLVIEICTSDLLEGLMHNILYINLYWE
jgi:hypothetical protein